MEEKNQKPVIYGGAVIIALLILALLLVVSYNSKNKKSLNAEKLASEVLLSEKLLIQKELDELKADYSDLEIKSNANAMLLEETNLKIADTEKRLNSLSNENRSLRPLKQELSDLQVLKANLEKEAAQLKTEYDNLKAQSNKLQESLSSSEAEKNDLIAQLGKAQTYQSDNFLITATRGKKTERIVVFAGRAKKLNLTFDVPQTLTEAISFKIITPSGATINPDDKSLSWILTNSENFTASISPLTGEFEQSRQVVLTYNPSEKLSKGEYKVQVLSEGVTIGNCRFKLK